MDSASLLSVLLVGFFFRFGVVCFDRLYDLYDLLLDWLIPKLRSRRPPKS